MNFENTDAVVTKEMLMDTRLLPNNR